MPSRRKRGKKVVWEAQVNKEGFGRKIKTFKTKGEATAWEVEVKKLLEQGLEPHLVMQLLDEGLSPSAIPKAIEEMQTPTVSLFDWQTDYLDYAQRFARKTFLEKRIVAKHLLEFFDPKWPIEAITPGRALEYLQHQFKTRSACVANKEKKNLQAAWNWGIKYRAFPQPNPFALVENYAHDVTGHYVPPEEDFRRVVDIAKGQDKVMLLTFLYTGARRGEIFKLKWDDVVFDQNEPRIALKTRKRKGGSLETNWIPMIPALVDLLRAHQKEAINEWVFVSHERLHFGKPFTARRHFPKNLCEEAGVKPFGFHGIRGLSASILAREGVPMKVIQGLLRHKSLATTERYVRDMVPIRPYLEVLDGGKDRKVA